MNAPPLSPPTLADILVALQPELDGQPLNGSHFERWDMPMFGGCFSCGASIAAHNAVPGKNGVLLGTCCATIETSLTLEESVAALLRQAHVPRSGSQSVPEPARAWPPGRRRGVLRGVLARLRREERRSVKKQLSPGQRPRKATISIAMTPRFSRLLQAVIADFLQDEEERRRTTRSEAQQLNAFLRHLAVSRSQEGSADA